MAEIDPMTGLPIIRPPAPLFRVDDFDWPEEYRFLILGQTGSGKTYLAKRLLDRKYGKVPLVVYQSKPRVASLDRLAATRVSKPSELAKLMKGNTREPLVILKPDPVEAQLRQTTEDFSEVMLYSRGPSIAYLDELSHFTGFSPIPAKMFAAYVTQGRELLKGILMAAQEPAYLPRYVYAESSAIVKMYLHGAVNLKAVRDKLPAALAFTPLPPGKHSLVLWDRREPSKAYGFRKAL